LILRAAKIALVFGVALYYALVLFNNLTDYNPNYQFVRHTLMMDTTFPVNHGMWRAVNAPAWHVIFFAVIVVWEFAATILCWWGGIRLTSAIAQPASTFRQAKNVAIAGLTMGLLLWLLAFLIIGGEWFLMWQSKTWNGEDVSARMFAVVGIVLLLVAQPEQEDGPS
jgi:predicted small integral membrane protein